MTQNSSFELNDCLPTTAAVGVYRSCAVCGSTQYVLKLNVFGDVRAVQIGDHNVANVPWAPSSGSTVLQTDSDSSNDVSSVNVHVVSDDVREPKKKLRQRRIPSSSSSSRSNVFVGEMKLLACQSDSSNLEQALDLFHNCITHLHPLRDNGQWDHFDLTAQDLLEKNADNLACQTIIYLEKSLALSLQGKLTESENLINDSMKNIPQMSGSIRRLLDVLMNCYMCQVSRRKQFLEQAKMFVETAKEKSRGFPPCLAIAIVLYEEGGYKRDFAATVKGWKKSRPLLKPKRSWSGVSSYAVVWIDNKKCTSESNTSQFQEWLSWGFNVRQKFPEAKASTRRTSKKPKYFLKLSSPTTTTRLRCKVDEFNG